MNEELIYNVIRIYNKATNKSYIEVGLNVDYTVKEIADRLGRDVCIQDPILQKEFTKYKEEVKRKYIDHDLYKYINYGLLTFDIYYSFEVLEQTEGLNYDVADKYILKNRELGNGYNKYTYKEVDDFLNYENY